MHRIDTPTAQIDKFGQGKNGFTNGDPSTGRRATDLNSDMWDAVQEEVANAIEGNGIALDKSKHNQLYLAIQKAITDKGYLQKANNLLDLESKTDARFNLGVYSRVESDNRFVDATGDRMTGALGSTHSDTYRIVSGKYGTFWRNDGNALYLMLTNENDSWGTFNNLRPLAVSLKDGSMTIGTQLAFDNPNFIRKTGVSSYESGGVKHNQTNGFILQGAGDQSAESHFLETVGVRTALRWRIRGGGLDAWPEFRNDGSLYLSGSWPVIKTSTGTTYHPDGNIEGVLWGGYLSNWLNRELTARDNNINGRVDWGTFNREVGARATNDYVNQNFVRDIRLAARGEIVTDGAMTEAPWGAVITGGNGNEGDQLGYMYFRYLQKNVNGNWYTVAYT